MHSGEKRFQVFISSTYRDLEAARQEVSKALLEANCFPAGMELFPASDMEQFDYIKSVIDESDYYILISAGKYGTIHPDTGISFTEMEYDYAVSIRKPIIRLLHKNPFKLLDDHLLENDDNKIAHLKKFRSKLETNRLVKHWNSVPELGKHVVLGLLEAQKRYPTQGWVRGARFTEENVDAMALRDLQTTVMNMARAVIGGNEAVSNTDYGDAVSEQITLFAKGLAADMSDIATTMSTHCDLLLLRNARSSPNYGPLVEIHQNANRMMSLVGQILAYSRQQKFKLEPIDIQNLIDDLTHLLRRLSGPKCVIEYNSVPDLEVVKADRRQIEQVIMNLVVNARDAMPMGGKVFISTENLHLSRNERISKTAVRKGRYVKISFSDQGIGIEEKNLEKIFLPYFTTKGDSAGSGLGLSTALGIAQQHQGYLFVERTSEYGSLFSLLLPIDPTPPAP